MGPWKRILKKLGEIPEMKIAKGSKSLIFTSFFISLFFFIIFLIVDRKIYSIFLFLFFISSLVTGILLIFFRDPERIIGAGIVTPADGKIVEISKEKNSNSEEFTRISTFMNIYNVHVNRMPYDGKINDIFHLSGSHKPAFKKESDKNERLIIEINTRIGLIRVVQIAGTFARRIVPYINKGDNIKKGERIGIIRFGSRVDISIPSKKIKDLCVKIGDNVKAGEDSLAKIND